MATPATVKRIGFSPMRRIPTPHADVAPDYDRHV
jgi:hypothetical protein